MLAHGPLPEPIRSQIRHSIRLMRSSLKRWGICGSLVFGLASIGWSQPADLRPTHLQASKALSPQDAAQSMKVPPGFEVQLFAGEPDVQQPIGFCLDDRGRLWVAEAYNYPNHGTQPGDRILIFEDQDGDGRFDRRTVFYDQLNYVTGIEYGFGGIWVMSPPYFYFIADANVDDVPDGPPRVLLDGFGNHANSHNLANALAWGPDGWLYGTHGRTNWSMIGKPGATDAERTRFDGGVYRYHPIRHVWEPFADGTTNPWGIDWDDYGQAFVCNCVNPHLFHILQGAHYEPWRNRPSSQYAYERIATIADHLHFVGDRNVWQGLGTPEEDTAGGGHAHCGTMVYLGDSWPAEYRNSIFMNNIHGHRINNDHLQRRGSGYVATHGPDFLRAKDDWYMGVTLAYGPDGGVYASDWNDTGECHSVTNTQRQTGRIFKITYGPSRQKAVDLSRATSEELAELQRHTNDWYVRHARRLLQERHASGQSVAPAVDLLRPMLVAPTETPRRLRALWALHAVGALDEASLLEILEDPDEHIQAWAIRLLTEAQPVPQQVIVALEQLAYSTNSPLVRLHLASALQRLEVAQRWTLVESLASHSEDRDDSNLPLMIWYGFEPLVQVDLSRFVALASQAQIPTIRRLAARRAIESRDASLALRYLVDTLVDMQSHEAARDMLNGMLYALQGQRNMKMPVRWHEAAQRLMRSSDDTVRLATAELAMILHEPQAADRLRQVAEDTTQSPVARNRAISALVTHRVDMLGPWLRPLLDDPTVRQSALRGLAEDDSPETPIVILDRYASFTPELRQDAIQTLSARPAWASALLQKVSSGAIPRSDLTAYTLRQMRNLQDEQLLRQLRELWGELRDTPADKAAKIHELKRLLTTENIEPPDMAQGKRVFQAQCATCHRLFGEGAEIGPDLTGSQRRNLDYLLENIVDPNAAVPREYQMQLIELESGRVITGFVYEETPQTVTIQTLNERLVIAKAEIENRDNTRVSIMPEGLLQMLTDAQIRDLIGYLQQ